MARTKNRGANKPKECKFLGDSKELKKYLITKKTFFEQILKRNKEGISDTQKEKLEGYVDAIEEMLDQKYFRGRRVYSMEEMIEEIKIERADLLEEIEVMKLELKKAKELADKAFKDEKCYYANKFEELYKSQGQVQLRHLVDEYQALLAQFEGLEKCRKTLWWLLGVIHRPTGFFENVIE